MKQWASRAIGYHGELVCAVDVIVVPCWTRVYFSKVIILTFCSTFMRGNLPLFHIKISKRQTSLLNMMCGYNFYVMRFFKINY